MADYDDVDVGDARKPPDDRRVVRKGAVAVEFVKIRAERFDVVERVGTIRVTGDERRLPGSERRVRLLEEFVGFRFERSDFGSDADRLRAFDALVFERAQFVDFRFEKLDVFFKVEKNFLGHDAWKWCVRGRADEVGPQAP